MKPSVKGLSTYRIQVTQLKRRSKNWINGGFFHFPFFLETRCIERMNLVCTWDHPLPTYEFLAQIYLRNLEENDVLFCIAWQFHVYPGAGYGL